MGNFCALWRASLWPNFNEVCGITFDEILVKFRGLHYGKFLCRWKGCNMAKFL